MAFPARGVVVAGRCRCRRSRGDGGSGAFAVLALAATLIMTAPPAWRAPSSRGRSLIVAEAAGEGAVRSAVSAFIHRGDEAHDGAVATPPKFLFSNEGGAAPAALWSTWLAGLSNRTDRPKAAALVAKLTYHPPDHAMRRARSLVGDTQRLHAFIRKLRAGRCVRVLNLGGSVTRGHGAGGIPSAYGIAFETLLNEAFPHCAPAEDARMRRHEVVVRASGGTASNFALQQFDANLHGIEAQVDMVLVEFAPNDSFMEVDARARSLTPTGGGDARRAEEAEEHDAPTGGRGSDDVSGEKTVQFYTEALVRRILSMRTGNGTLPAAAVWLESSWMSEGLRGVLLQRNNADRGDAARTDGIDPKTMAIMTRWGSWDPMVLMASLAHHAVLNWYQVPTVSLVDVLAPLTFNSFGPWNEGGYDESSAFAWANIAADQCCHPNAAGHIIMALMLARELDHEAHVYGVPRLPEEEDRSARVLSHSSAESGSASSVAGSGQDAAALLPPQARAHLRPLLWLSPGDEKRYLAPPYFSLDFMDSRLAGTGASVIAPGALGWSVEEDVPGKQGLLAREPGSHAAIVLPVAAVRRAHPEEDRMILSIGYLSSYSGFSSISYWVDHSPALAAERADALEPRRCRSDFNMSLERQVIVASRRSNRGQVSVFETVATEPIAMAAGARDMYLHVCLHPIHIRGSLFARKGKFKLLTVVGVHAEGGA